MTASACHDPRVDPDCFLLLAFSPAQRHDSS
jgi:hypothetical protein